MTADAEMVRHQVEAWEHELRVALSGLYGGRADTVADIAIARAGAAATARRPALRELDVRRLLEPDWFQRPERVGYAAYADRLGGTLGGVAQRIPYLRDLGVDVLHLMSVARTRDGENDGGYAVADYLSPQPSLGSTGALIELIDRLRAEDISLCLDLVMNHTSDDHPWALAARAGSEYHRALYRTFPDRTEPDAYEATLPEVFPNMAPGNFTWVGDLDAWVWTTFREFQWDLDWSNPDVFVEMVDVVLGLADLGVEVIRLDAVAFTWKRLGTNSQNQPEAHLIAQALRAVLGMAAPAVILLAEAIVGPDDLVGYLGRHRLERRECELAYHNQLMVQSWSMLAERSARQATGALRRLPSAPTRTAWLTYVRCHDDIGWAIADEDAAAVGLDGFAHRRFLAEFYRGDFWGSFARGTAFATNAETGDERTCGMAAALCGLTAALDAGDDGAVTTAIDRLTLLYAIAFGYGGVPLVYMGDELGQGDDPDATMQHDARWRHRPRFDDTAAAARHDSTTVAGRVWERMRALVVARRSCAVLHAAGTTEPVWSGDDGVFAWIRRHPRHGTMVGLANVTPDARTVDEGLVSVVGSSPCDLLAPHERAMTSLRSHQVRWVTSDDDRGPVPTPPATGERATSAERG